MSARRKTSSSVFLVLLTLPSIFYLLRYFTAALHSYGRSKRQVGEETQAQSATC